MATPTFPSPSPQIHDLGREHGKLKAAHMKATARLQQQSSRLEVASKEVEQALQDKADAEQALQVEKTKLQTQIAQFTKLVDYKTATPGNRPLPSKKVGPPPPPPIPPLGRKVFFLSPHSWRAGVFSCLFYACVFAICLLIFRCLVWGAFHRFVSCTHN